MKFKKFKLVSEVEGEEEADKKDKIREGLGILKRFLGNEEKNIEEMLTQLEAIKNLVKDLAGGKIGVEEFAKRKPLITGFDRRFKDYKDLAKQIDTATKETLRDTAGLLR